MVRFAMFVDAGYLFAAGAQAVHGTHVARRNISVQSCPKLVTALTERAATITQIPSALRIYWYDALQGPRMSLEQTALANESGIKLRLGTLNNAGEQKGVDSLIVTDIIDLSRNRAIVDAVLVSGDEDLRIAVQIAQSFGVRVHLLAVGDASQNVSPSLRMEADSVDSLDSAWLGAHLKVEVAPPHIQLAPQGLHVVPATDLMPDLEEAAKATVAELLAPLSDAKLSELFVHFAGSKVVPPEYDGRLIAKTAARMAGKKFDGGEKRQIRGVFVAETRLRQQSRKNETS